MVLAIILITLFFEIFLILDHYIWFPRRDEKKRQIFREEYKKENGYYPVLWNVGT